jgi:hypothetical protein
MKDPKPMIIAMIIGLALLLAPIVSASAVPFGNSMIKTDSEFSGDAVLNETIDIKWTTGTDTYEWKQSSVYKNTLGQKTQSVLNFRQENGSLTWSFQRNGFNVPFQSPVNQYMDDSTIIKRQYLPSYQAIPLMPGIQLF